MCSKTFWLAVLGLTAALPVFAQVSVELVLNQEKYMQYEPIYARVRLRNYSGQPLVFGKNEQLKGELLLEIEHDHRIVPLQSAEDFSLIGTVLMPGQTSEFVFQVNRYYRLTKPGRYTMHAYVRHKMLPSMFRSADTSLEISPGVELWRRTVGVPDVLSGARSGAERRKGLELRTFSLRVLEERATRHYYIVVEDPKRVFGVIRAGRDVSSAVYSIEVDMLSRLHLVVPVANKLYRYMVVNLDGRIEQQEMLKQDQDVPRLIRDRRTGQITRVGGVEAMPGVDYKVPEMPKKAQP